MALNSAQLIATGQLDGFRNRIINGDMRIDQRESGASHAIPTVGGGVYTLDRWRAGGASDATGSVQRSTSAPVGFVNSLQWTTTLADPSLAAGQYGVIWQLIEGNNVADLAWGTVNAQSVTLSFWVRSSLTGLFGGALRNSDYTRSYPFTYTISAADTWEKKTVTVPGDTAGTWPTDTTDGISVLLGLGSGTTFSGPAGAWAATNYITATGTTSVIGTLNATFYVTGVQLEKGPVATDFDFRSYGQELAMCQRYFCKSYGINTTPGSVEFNAGNPNSLSATNLDWIACNVSFPVTMRSTPSAIIYRPSTGVINTVEDAGEANPRTVNGIELGQNGIGLLTLSSNSPAPATAYQFQYTASAEL